MTKFITEIAFISCVVLLASCNTKADRNAAKPTASPVARELTAQDVAKTLSDSRLPIVDLVSVTEASDDNHLLGRPGQYTSKVFFYDRRHPRTGEDEGENTIEVFPTASAAQQRRDYVAAVTKNLPMLLTYQFLRGKILIRLHKILLPSEADEYRRAIEAMPLTT